MQIARLNNIKIATASFFCSFIANKFGPKIQNMQTFRFKKIWQNIVWFILFKTAILETKVMEFQC